MLFGEDILKLILEFYLIFIVIYFVLKFFTSNQRVFSVSIVFLTLYGVIALGQFLSLGLLNDLLRTVEPFIIIAYVVLMVPDIRRSIDVSFKKRSKNDDFMMGSEHTKNQIIEAIMTLSGHKIGALITIEKHNTLEQFAERAIIMNSRVSKELLLNIFTPLTPLHDGAVIIRGDLILCAGAYYVLSDNENVENTMGSRHRAGLGISELTDALTIIVSEETGTISIALEGFLKRNCDREKVLEYLDKFMK
jgi:diadenylate cyclase